MGKIELPTVIISIIENYAHEFERVDMLEYAIQKIINRLDRGSGKNIYLWVVRSHINRVARDLKTILTKEIINERARLKARIRPVTYTRHLRFLKKDTVCTRRMNLLSDTITTLSNAYSTWVDFGEQYKNTIVYKRCVEEFGEPEVSTTLYCRATGACEFFKTTQSVDKQIDKKSLFRL